MREKIQFLIEEYENAIELLEQDRAEEKYLTVANAYRTAKIGVFQKVVDDLQMLFDGGVEILETEKGNEDDTKYLNINVSDGEVKRNPDVVRLCSDAGILEYVRKEQERVDDYRDRLDELEREEYYESKYGKEQE